MRIGVLTTSYPRQPNDPAGSFVAGLGHTLARRGAEVEVIAAGPGQERDGALAITRVDGRGLFYEGGAPERLARGPAAWPTALAFSARFAAAAAARASRWDAIVSHWLLPSGITGALLSRGRPHVAIAHSGDVHLLEQIPCGRLLATRLARSSARLCFVSSDLRARFRRLAPHARGIVAPMGTIVPVMPPAPPPRAPFTVLFLGRLVPIKGAAILIEAAAKLPDFRFLVAGNGPERAALGALATRNVVFLGEIGGASKAAALAGAHLVCVPSIALPDGRTEGAPTVIAEAFAAARPVLVSRTGGLPELTGDAGIVVPPGDASALASALTALAADPSYLNDLTRRARARAERLDWSVRAPALLGSLWDALSPTASGAPALHW